MRRHLQGPAEAILGNAWPGRCGGTASSMVHACQHQAVSWRAWSDVKASFGNASSVGNCVVFNIKGNDYRLITRILYVSQKVFVLKVMTHKEYDTNRWKDECGCFAVHRHRKGK